MKIEEDRAEKIDSYQIKISGADDYIIAIC